MRGVELAAWFSRHMIDRIMGNNYLKQLSFGARSLFFPVVPVVSNLKPHG